MRQDLKQPTEEKARVLADLQRNPLALARYIVQEYDKEQQRRQERSEEDFEDEDGNANSQVQESRWISLLRSDKYGQLVETPKFRKFATDYVAGRWRDLAIKSGYSHSSGMAMPSDDLPRGTVCVPHLPEGDVILTRYRSRSVPPKRKSLTQTIFASTATATTRNSKKPAMSSG